MQAEITKEDLEIAQDCTAQGHRLSKVAESLREQIAGYRDEIRRCGDPEVRKHLLELIVRCQDGAALCDVSAAVWYDEAERWESGRV